MKKSFLCFEKNPWFTPPVMLAQFCFGPNSGPLSETIDSHAFQN